MSIVLYNLSHSTFHQFTLAPSHQSYTQVDSCPFQHLCTVVRLAHIYMQLHIAALHLSLYLAQVCPMMQSICPVYVTEFAKRDHFGAM